MTQETKQHSVSMFGERLRREREMRGVSLDEIAEATKIGTRLLRALEEEQFDLLPGGIFNKGFVRAYAKYLGINEEQAVAEYMQAAGETSTDLQMLAQPYRSEVPAYVPAQESRSGGPTLLLAVIVLAVIGGAFGAWKLYEQYTHDKERAAAAALARLETPPQAPSVADTGSAPVNQTAGQGAAASLPAAGSGGASTASSGDSAQGDTKASQANSQGGASNAVVPGQPFEVVLRTTGPAWVSIKADGKIVVRGIVQPDQTKTIHATSEIVLWTGNAGSTQVTFQGQPVPVTGGTNEVKLLVFTPQGLQPPKPRAAGPEAPTSEPKTAPQ